MNVYDIEVLDHINFYGFDKTIYVVANNPMEALEEMIQKYPKLKLEEVKSITLYAKDVILHSTEIIIIEDDNKEERK